MLDPTYGEGVEEVLDQIESDDKRTPLWNALVEALNKICDEPDGPEARRFGIHHPAGYMIWRVPVRVGNEDQDWCILWAPDGPDAVILYVGAWPPA